MSEANASKSSVSKGTVSEKGASDWGVPALGRPSSGHCSLTVDEVKRLAFDLSRDLPAPERWIFAHRGHICPFEKLVPLVPMGATVLDIGCGSGLFLALLAATGRIARGIGIDVSAPKVTTASALAKSRKLPLEFHAEAEFERWLSYGDEVSFVSAIDVLHHVPRAEQSRFVETLCRAVPPRGRLLVKEMALRPRWMSALNRVHDLVMTRSWIHTVAQGELTHRLDAHGLDVAGAGRATRLWYSHYWCVAERRSA